MSRPPIMTAQLAQTFYAEAGQLGACLKAAQPGQSFIYAKGERLDPAHPTEALVLAEVAAGRAVRNIAGRDSEGNLRWQVKMIGGGVESVSAILERGPAAQDTPGSGRDMRVLEFLRSLRSGGPLPSLRAVALGAGLTRVDNAPDRFAARRALARLRAAGLLGGLGFK